MSHTPGPWEVWTSCSFRRIGSHEGMVCEPVVQNDGHPDLYFRNGGPDGPDALLLVAAPDLLEALEELSRLEPITDDGEDLLERARDKARAAIAKAKGTP